MRLIFTVIIWACLSANAYAQELLLFGGENNKTFLGCVNCNRYDSGSICNPYGPQGNKYNGESIWNRYGTFGSSYSSSSPWNRYASKPPVIVDRQGKFYGYFSANRYLSNRTRIEYFIQMAEAVAEGEDLDTFRDRLCDL